MKHFLLQYRRSTGRLLDLRDLGEDRSKALALRFAAEKELRTDPDVEVVILAAQTRDALIHTHSRYFKTLSQLTDELSSTADKDTCPDGGGNVPLAYQS